MVERRPELLGQHVVGIAAEGVIEDGAVRRVGSRRAHASKLREMAIGDVDALQLGLQVLAVEPRMPTRLRDASDVNQQAHTARREQLKEPFDGVVGVADG